jgi:HlyD family secretion protein
MVTHVSESESDIKQVLRMDRPTGSRKRTLWLWTLLALLLLGGLAYLLLAPSNGNTVRYETAEIKQGDLKVTVTATGTLQPVNEVDVGSELSGTIESVEADFNDQVKKGQVLARLNTDRLHADVMEARATMASDKAKVVEAKATTLETRLAYARCEKLAARKLCSQEELDGDRAKYERAKAVEASANAQVAVANATLGGKETELNKAVIRSPINGLVLLRQIEPGQTVAASLQAPVLFTLAEDLAQMELHVAVDEADVGQIAEGQTAEFTVDAYPDRTFPATITQVRYAPQTVDGVVTYETVLAVDNSDLTLRPGMTATSVITVRQLHDVTLLPNAALRFSPPVTKTAHRSRGIFGSIFRRPRSSDRRSNEEKNGGQKVWVPSSEAPRAITVTTGASDGKFTELKSGGLQPGQAVIVDTIGTK